MLCPEVSNQAGKVVDTSVLIQVLKHSIASEVINAERGFRSTVAMDEQQRAGLRTVTGVTAAAANVVTLSHLTGNFLDRWHGSQAKNCVHLDGQVQDFGRCYN